MDARWTNCAPSNAAKAAVSSRMRCKRASQRRWLERSCEMQGAPLRSPDRGRTKRQRESKAVPSGHAARWTSRLQTRLSSRESGTGRPGPVRFHPGHTSRPYSVFRGAVSGRGGSYNPRSGYHAALLPLGWALERTSQREESETESSTVAQARDATRRHTRRDATSTSYNSTPRRASAVSPRTAPRSPRPGRDAQRTREPARQTPGPRGRVAVRPIVCFRFCVGHKTAPRSCSHTSRSTITLDYKTQTKR